MGGEAGEGEIRGRSSLKGVEETELMRNDLFILLHCHIDVAFPCGMPFYCRNTNVFKLIILPTNLSACVLFWTLAVYCPHSCSYVAAYIVHYQRLLAVQFLSTLQFPVISGELSPVVLGYSVILPPDHPVLINLIHLPYSPLITVLQLSCLLCLLDQSHLQTC